MEVPYALPEFQLLLAYAFGAVIAFGMALIVVSVFRP